MIGVRWGLLFLGLLGIAQRCGASMVLGGSCVSHTGEPGDCVPIRECAPLIEIAQKSAIATDNHRVLRNSRCGDDDSLVCCPSPLPQHPHCGLSDSSKLVGGVHTEIDEFPWTALIQHRKENGDLEFLCGGTLINKRYTVTAAHCVTRLPDSWQVHRVRLGEYNIATTEDCQDSYCAAPPIDVPISEIFPHGEYAGRRTNHQHDIALVRHAKEVDFSDTVRPICLPLRESVRGAIPGGSQALVTGWQLTSGHELDRKKMYMSVNVKSLKECADFYQGRGIALQPTQMCISSNKMRDGCDEDPDGPLMRKVESNWYLFGIFSMSSRACSSEVPLVYTNVSEYIDWIREKVRH